MLNLTIFYIRLVFTSARVNVPYRALCLILWRLNEEGSLINIKYIFDFLDPFTDALHRIGYYSLNCCHYTTLYMLNKGAYV